MNNFGESRRRFLKAAGLAGGTILFSSRENVAQMAAATPRRESTPAQDESGSADYTLRIKESPIEIAPKRIISLITYLSLIHI